MNFIELFSDKILERGYDYYKNGFVKECYKNDNIIHAVVSGTDDYEVEIGLENGEVSYMECTCPYAEDGSYCKHMVAVLYYYNSREYINIKTTNSTNKPLDELIDDLNFDEMKFYLTKVLKSNYKLEHKFREYFDKRNVPFDIADLKNEFEQIISSNTYNFGIVAYNNCEDFLTELDFFLSENTEKLLNNKLYQDAFDFATYVMNEMSDIQLEDLDCECSYVTDSIGIIFNAIFENDLVNFKEKSINYFKFFLQKSSGYDFFDALYSIAEINLINLVSKNSFYDFKIECAKKELLTIEDNSNHKCYLIENVILLMEQSNKNEDEILPCYLDNLDYENIRKRYIYKLLKNNQKSEAIKFINERMKTDYNSNFSMKFYVETLKNIYKTTDKEKYIEQLYLQLYKYDFGSLDIFRELKKCYSKGEWKEKRLFIIEKLKKSYNIHEIYDSEKMYDELLILVEENSYYLSQYANKLKSKYPEQILEIYKKQVLKSAEHTGGRNHYNKIVKDLNFMLTINNSTDIVKEIVSLFKSSYKNRRAMQEELYKVKI